MKIVIESDYSLWRWFQYKIVKIFQIVRFMTLVVSRQHGKTIFGVDLLVDWLFRYKKRKNPEATIVMETAAQAFAVYFKRTHQILEPLEGILYHVQKSNTGVTVVTFKRPWFGDAATLTFSGTGNAESLRGRTNDLVIIDEAGRVASKVWYEILKETLDDTKGKALITSTQRGRSWFYVLQKSFEKMREEGEDWVANAEFDNVSAMVRTDEEIRRQEALAKATGKWAAYLQEQKNDPDAVDLEEAPFALHVLSKRREGQTGTVIKDIRQYGAINVSVDIGKPNNNAAWIYAVMPDGRVHFLDYQDKYDSYQLIDYIYHTYKGLRIKIIYPFDAKSPVVDTGVPLLKQLKDHAAKYRNINFEVLPKRTSEKKLFLLKAVETFSQSLVDLIKCVNGVDKLSGSRLKKDPKTEYINYGDLVRNGNQHAVDAMGYAGVALSMRKVYKVTNYEAHGFYTEYKNAGIGQKYSKNTRFKY